jgi:hypothetical protein
LSSISKHTHLMLMEFTFCTFYSIIFMRMWIAQRSLSLSIYIYNRLESLYCAYYRFTLNIFYGIFYWLYVLKLNVSCTILLLTMSVVSSVWYAFAKFAVVDHRACETKQKCLASNHLPFSYWQFSITI